MVVSASDAVVDGDAFNPYHPADLFDALQGALGPYARETAEQFVEIVARPGEQVAGLIRPGDLLVARALGEGDLSDVSMVVSEEIWTRRDCDERHLRCRSRRPGRFAQVIRPGTYGGGRNARVVDRIADLNGRVPFNMLIIRERRTPVILDRRLLLHGEAEDACDAEDEFQPSAESAESSEVCFPSGECLPLASGQAESSNEEYWDPNASGVPLLDTSGRRSAQLSAHFTVDELVRSGGHSFRYARIDPALVQCLEAIRAEVGQAVVVNSGYRSWGYNRRLYERRGTTPTRSQHCSGRAADIRVRGLSGMELAEAALRACGCRMGVGIGMGSDDRGVHVDVRGSWARWGYGSRKAEYVRRIQAYHDARCSGGGRGDSDLAVDEAEGFGESEERDATSNPEYVRWIQHALNQVTGATLAVDGDYGPRTREAVRRFQQNRGLAVDGVVGPQTDATLRLALGHADRPTTSDRPDLAAACGGLTAPVVFDRFDFNGHALKPHHEPLIEKIAGCVSSSDRSDQPVRGLRIVGHTDPVGSDAANLELGRRRAEAVRARLLPAIDNRAPGRTEQMEVTVESRGEQQPLSSSAALNRRVEVTLQRASAPPIPVPPVPPVPPPAITIDDLREAQRCLGRLLAIELEPTGTLDAPTREAVRRFQTEQGDRPHHRNDHGGLDRPPAAALRQPAPSVRSGGWPSRTRRWTTQRSSAVRRHRWRSPTRRSCRSPRRRPMTPCAPRWAPWD